MYVDKIQSLESEIQELNKYIKADKKEIKKREKILNMEPNDDLEVEILVYKDEIENLREQLKMKKQLLKNYKKL